MKQETTEKLLKWLDRETKKDVLEIEKEKKDFLKEIKKIKKEDILPKPIVKEKLTIWKRIKKVLMG